MKYYLGLDNGCTTTKAALFTGEGEEVGIVSTETRAITPHSGFCEQDMEEMWKANCSVIRGLLAQTGVAPGDVAGVAVCGHGKGLYLWGKDGKPVRNGILSTDNRAWEYPVKWKKDGTEGKAFALSCQHILACQPVSLLAWLKDHEPESLENVQWIFECKDYIRFRLTGEARGEYTDYSGTNFMNLYTRGYDAELLKLFGLEELFGALPPLCGSTDVCGSITRETAQSTGLAEGTPVAGGMFDIDACAVAVNVVDEDHVCMIAGSWSINEYIRKEPVTSGKVLMNSLFCIPEYYLIEESSPTSAANNEWFVKTLLPELAAEQQKRGGSVYDIANEWVESVPASEFCPIFLPFLYASNVHPNAMGSFTGLSSYHTRAHLMRGIYEGIAFSHKYHLDKLLATRTKPVKSIRLAGGVTQSGVWTRIFADVTQLPVESAGALEPGALGCAVSAAVASGEYADFAQATERMCRLAPAVLPNRANAEIYAKKYGMYLKVISALDAVWDDMRDMRDMRDLPL